MHSEGDLDINVGEWTPFSGAVPEDIAKLKFTYSRTCTYAHPRTTMLMFGPKNAPAKQTQFLYLFGRGSSALGTTTNDNGDDSTYKTARPRRALVLTMTQFDGIPMADMFKVLQYWAFEDRRPYSEPSELCRITVGVHVHFIKSTMLRGQVISGVKDELTVLAKKYIIWAKNRTEDLIIDEEAQVASASVLTAAPAIGENSTVVGEEFVGEAVSLTPAAPSTQRRQSPRRLSDSARAAAELEAMTPTPGVSTEAKSDTLVMVMMGVFVVVVLMQWWTNRSLKAYIANVDSKLDLLQRAFEATAHYSKSLGDAAGRSEL